MATGSIIAASLGALGPIMGVIGNASANAKARYQQVEGRLYDSLDFARQKEQSVYDANKAKLNAGTIAMIGGMLTLILVIYLINKK